MVLNKDFREFIGLLNENKVLYLIVGGYAVGFHGYPRYTKDLDVWLLVSGENADNILIALQKFGFGSLGLSKEDFLDPEQMIQLGQPPNRIDLVLSCDGVAFKTCHESRNTIEVDGLTIDLINLENLKINKKASGRLQDLADLDNLSQK